MAEPERAAPPLASPRVASDAEVDVVIVGAGAGGAACAWGLTNAGVRVLVLEAGPAFDPHADYALHKPDWALHDFPAHKARHPARYGYAPLQELQARWDHLRSWNVVSGRLNRTRWRSAQGYLHVRGVGGSTLHFTGESHRMHAEAMRMRSRFGVAADWPLSYRELEHFYEQAEALIGVAGPPDGWPRGRRGAYPQPPHDVSYGGARVIEAGRRLGLAWEPNSLAVLSRPMGDRPGCNYCNNCQRGCPRRDKGSADVTFMAAAQATGRCTLWTDAPVRELHLGSDARVQAVTVQRGDARQRVRCRLLVLACGAVETPRLLLLTPEPGSGHGLGNAQGQVGRHFMETLAWSSTGLHPDNLGSHRGLPSELVCWAHNAPDALPGVPGGYRLTARTGEAGFTSPAAYAQRLVPGWGGTHLKALQAAFGHALSIGAVAESLPNPGSFVDLDPALTDDAGLPAARIHAHLDDTELKRLEAAAAQCRAMLAACGVPKPLEEYGSADMFAATHVFGTCRMGRDPRDSVVDAHGRVHAWKNLYIADASVFPSSGGGESPSLTVQALALRTAQQLRSDLVQRRV